MKNWPSKLLAVVLAVIMWYFVVGEERAEVGLTVPLVLINIPRDLIVVNNVTQGIEIRVNGPRSLVRALSTESLSKSLDLSSTKEGTITFSITSEGIPLPRGVTITRINPTQITVVLQKLMTKTIQVQPKVNGKPESGYEIESVRVNPERVEIAGPENIVRKVDHLFTKPVEIEGTASNVKQRIYLDFRNLQIYLVKDEPLEVEVKIKKNHRK
ncbi:MAG: CdaR family protein [Thermodesulfobacteriota bacterium]